MVPYAPLYRRPTYDVSVLQKKSTMKAFLHEQRLNFGLLFKEEMSLSVLQQNRQGHFVLISELLDYSHEDT